MTTEQSWDLTPREFDALYRVYAAAKEAEVERWNIERVERLNAPHFHKVDARGEAVPYKLQDFLRQPQSDSGDIQAAIDAADLARELARDKQRSREMRSANYDDSWLPGWARMAPQERKDKGLG